MKIKTCLLSVILYFIMSLSSLSMKYASIQANIIYKLLLYCLSMLFLGVFAFFWQKLLKKFDLSSVYYFKTTTIIWGMIFGYTLFGEKITLYMIIGSILAICGVCIIMREEQ